MNRRSDLTELVRGAQRTPDIPRDHIIHGGMIFEAAWSNDMTLLRILGLVLAFGLALPGIALAAPPEIPKPKSFALWYISAKDSAQIVVAIVLHEVNGDVAICGGLWPADERGDSTASRERFHKSIVKVRGKIIPATLEIFPLYATREAAKTFRCFVSAEPWEGPYRSNDFRLRLPEIPESD